MSPCRWCYHRASLHTTELGCMSCDCPAFRPGRTGPVDRGVVLFAWLVVAIGTGAMGFALLALLGRVTGW